MPAAVADPKRSLDSEQISPATIAHHTVYEKTPNLHQSHMCQWGAQPYLVGPLFRLVDKPPLSPWLSKNVLPLTKAGNDPNTAISLTELLDRILFYVCNSVCFGVQKAKDGDRGTIVFTATLSRIYIHEERRLADRPGSSEVPRNPLTRWDVSSIPANRIFLPKTNGWRTMKSLVHKIRLHGRRGKGMAESFSREKLRHAPQKGG